MINTSCLTGGCLIDNIYWGLFISASLLCYALDFPHV